MWKYLIAIVLVAHGIGQLLPILAALTNEKIFTDASWLFSARVGIRTPLGQAFALTDTAFPHLSLVRPWTPEDSVWCAPMAPRDAYVIWQAVCERRT
jgi:hypothetical protein